MRGTSLRACYISIEESRPPVLPITRRQRVNGQHTRWLLASREDNETAHPRKSAFDRVVCLRSIVGKESMIWGEEET